MFILDRTNGKPLFGVTEKPVAKGDAPGEWYSPTQPFPNKPPALGRTSFKKEDIVTAEDTTPEHAKACQDLYERAGGFYNVGPYTPFLYHEAGTPRRVRFSFQEMADRTGAVRPRTHTRLCFRVHTGRGIGGLDRKESAGGNYGNLTQGRHSTIAAALPAWPIRVYGQWHAVSETAMGPALGGECGDRGYCMARHAGCQDNLPAEKQDTGRAVPPDPFPLPVDWCSLRRPAIPDSAHSIPKRGRNFG
jgi:quinoprotein glucose dehydrogenase